MQKSLLLSLSYLPFTGSLFIRFLFILPLNNYKNNRNYGYKFMFPFPHAKVSKLLILFSGCKFLLHNVISWRLPVCITLPQPFMWSHRDPSSGCKSAHLFNQAFIAAHLGFWYIISLNIIYHYVSYILYV